MKTKEQLLESLQRAKERHKKMFKEKAASPKEIMAKADVCAKEIAAIEEEIRKHAK
jgi:hypothetical protein